MAGENDSSMRLTLLGDFVRAGRSDVATTRNRVPARNLNKGNRGDNWELLGEAPKAYQTGSAPGVPHLANLPFAANDDQKAVAEDTIADVESSGLWPGKVAPERLHPHRSELISCPRS